jgi:hypothetical protein
MASCGSLYFSVLLISNKNAGLIINPILIMTDLPQK